MKKSTKLFLGMVTTMVILVLSSFSAPAAAGVSCAGVGVMLFDFAQTNFTNWIEQTMNMYGLKVKNSKVRLKSATFRAHLPVDSKSFDSSDFSSLAVKSNKGLAGANGMITVTNANSAIVPGVFINKADGVATMDATKLAAGDYDAADDASIINGYITISSDSKKEVDTKSIRNSLRATEIPGYYRFEKPIVIPTGKSLDFALSNLAVTATNGDLIELEFPIYELDAIINL